MEKIFGFSFMRRKKIEQTAQYLKDEYIQKTKEVKNTFNSDFYCLCTEFAYVDALSCFAETDCKGNIFYENFDLMDNVAWERFFKITALYNTIKVCLKRRKDLSCEEMKEDLFFVYDFDEIEKHFFELIWKMAFSFENRFNMIFPQVMIKYVLRKSITDPLSLAFTDNFCYNSYSSLIKYFSKYISIGRRIRLAKQA